MVDSITYRTTDDARWGSGQGSNLAPHQIDVNFWVLYSQLQTLLSEIALTASIDSFQVIGNQLYVHLTNHTILGPYTLPQATWNFRGQWAPTTEYFVNDVFQYGDVVYIVLFHHTSAGTFDPFANDGSGHDYYQALLQAPSNGLPDGGIPGQVLVVQTAGSPHGVPVSAWQSLTRNIALFAQGVMAPSELLMQYVVPEDMTLPLHLSSPNSKAYSAGIPATTQTFTIYKNNVSIGSVAFHSDGSVVFTLATAVSFVPGDVLSITSPSVPDAHQHDVSITLVATTP